MNEVVRDDCFSKSGILSRYILGLPCTPPDFCNKTTSLTVRRQDPFAPAMTWLVFGASSSK